MALMGFRQLPFVCVVPETLVQKLRLILNM